jgi:predicted DNA-binding protein with PD1-like motif
MKSRILSNDDGVRTHVVVLDSGEEAFATLTHFANEAGVAGASISAIGAFESAIVGWFDFQTKQYKKIPIGEQCEVLSALGDVATGDDGKAILHVHAVLGLSDGSTRGGHLLEGRVRPTLEVILTETPKQLRRRKRGDLGAALIDLEPSTS